MNKRELKKFEKLLLAERERLLKGVKAIEEDVLYQPAELSRDSDVTSLAEVGTDSFERETALTLANTETKRLSEINEALIRVQDGTYGICQGTGEPIPQARLEVCPTARYCIAYQEKLEKGEEL